jgi:hypothetical protein
MGYSLLRQVDGIPGEDRRTRTTMSNCNYCGALLYWRTKWAYEINSRIEYYEGCQGIVWDRQEGTVVFADLLEVKPKYVTPRHHCPNYDQVLQVFDEKIYDKGLSTLF